MDYTIEPSEEILQAIDDEQQSGERIMSPSIPWPLLQHPRIFELYDCRGSEWPDRRYVYFIRGSCRGPIKIGSSRNPEDRLVTLQTSHPDQLILMAAINDRGHSWESTLHQHFARFRMRGEWFWPAPSLIAFIRWIIRRDETCVGSGRRCVQDCYGMM